jgi:diaminohydroxyphosphoribosylaminopyrimidine deaminase/5-amino-6-(5-phosphoribosylamino)uracil reductase|tara:strand:- start:2289 stop:3365 length:1077 start_codon:yes stop_codon:yes gene_type:complete
MRLALAQAQKNLGNTNENPSVGCVITKNGSVVSIGCTSIRGRPHAEYNAINQSKTNLKDAKLYVTLEPCSNYGKTSPCTKSIINSGIKKVFFSINDPDFKSYNKCSRILESKKIRVIKGICTQEVNSFYNSYIKSKISLLPFVTCKLAISKDFFTINKKKRWITNKFSRGRVHMMRSNHDCIMTSIKTIINDNSRLTCRINGLKNKSPSKIILDSKLRIPLNSNVLKETFNHRTIIFYNKFNKKKIKSLKKIKIELFKIPIDVDGNLDLHDALIKAKKLGFYRIFLETGMKLTINFLQKNLIDDLNLFISNKRLGKNGENNIKKQLKLFLKNKKKFIKKVNLFGEKIITYKIKQCLPE